jgi:hypothetical protein
MKVIKNYDEIILQPNTLIIMDIDDTLIKFNSIGKTWWKDINEYYAKHNDVKIAKQLAYNDWKSIIEKEKPELLDTELFLELLDRIDNTNSKLILLTARDVEMKPYTLKNIHDCGIHIEPEYVHHAWPKGKKVKELYEKYPGDHIVFVDDYLDNIEDVIKEVPNSICYLIEHEKL